MKDFITKVAKLQATLKAPKGQTNKFGNYKYRSCEDILEAVKPLLDNAGLVLTVTDDIVIFGENTPNPRFYVKAIATITDGTNHLTNSAFARESEEKKGMDTAQVTGACSSYARKYALNGLLLIDDTKDADATETHGKEEVKSNTTTPAKSFTTKAKDLNESTNKIAETLKPIVEATTTSKKGGWSSRKTNATETTNTKGDLY